MDMRLLIQAQLFAPAFMFQTMLEGLGRLIDAPRSEPSLPARATTRRAVAIAPEQLVKRITPTTLVPEQLVGHIAAAAPTAQVAELA